MDLGPRVDHVDHVHVAVRLARDLLVGHLGVEEPVVAELRAQGAGVAVDAVRVQEVAGLGPVSYTHLTLPPGVLV